MYLSKKHLTSEMCMVSLMVVSRLRTSRRPLFSVLSLTITVKRTPISSYLQHKENFVNINFIMKTLLKKLLCIVQKMWIESVTLCANSPEIMTLCPSIQAMWKFQLQETLGANPHKPLERQLSQGQSILSGPQICKVGCVTIFNLPLLLFLITYIYWYCKITRLEITDFAHSFLLV